MVDGMSHVWSQFIAGELSASYVTPLGSLGSLAWLWEACTWFPWPLSHEPFPFADFALYSFIVINHICDYDSL